MPLCTSYMRARFSMRVRFSLLTCNTFSRSFRGVSSHDEIARYESSRRARLFTALSTLSNFHPDRGPGPIESFAANRRWRFPFLRDKRANYNFVSRPTKASSDRFNPFFDNVSQALAGDSRILVPRN